jgi:AmpE protein
MKFIVLLFTILLQKQTKKQGYKRKRRWFTRMAKPVKAMMGMDDLVSRAESNPDTKADSKAGATLGSTVDSYLDNKPESKPDKGVTYQALAFFLLVLLPSLAIGLTIGNLQGLSGSLVALVLQVALLLYILGRDDFSQKFDDYKACWLRGDYQGAFECAKGFLGVKQQVMASPCELHQAASKAMVHAWFLRFFVFVFWYLALGIGGALASLLSYWFYREFKFHWARSVLAAIEWAPVRLLALTTALAGDFTHSFPTALKFLFDFHTPADDVLFKTISPGAVDAKDFDCDGAEDLLQETNQLMFRSGVIWLILVALLTVFTGF